MNIELKMLDKKDYKKAIEFAIKGMHFNIYFENEFLTNLYGKYFLYSEMIKATQIIAAYNEDELVGLLIARIDNEEKCYHSLGKSLYVNIFEFIQNTFFKDSAGEYSIACREMLEEYKKTHNPDGEIIFLATNQKVKGLGTMLLEELEKRETEKLIYLYTDEQCTYQFYEHRGFERVSQKEIMLSLKNKIPLKCMLYSKKLNRNV